MGGCVVISPPPPHHHRMATRSPKARHIDPPPAGLAPQFSEPPAAACPSESGNGRKPVPGSWHPWLGSVAISEHTTCTPADGCCKFSPTSPPLHLNDQLPSGDVDGGPEPPLAATLLERHGRGWALSRLMFHLLHLGTVASARTRLADASLYPASNATCRLSRNMIAPMPRKRSGVTTSSRPMLR